ncbi:MAG: FG-GAP repeat protein [Verrucomicrobiae bacterium]|nr:FG-GAP repeat protein [Verrucomicrobiae bacterium]
MTTFSKYAVTGIIFSLASFPACSWATGDAKASLRENSSHDSLLALMDAALYAVDHTGPVARAGNPANRFRMDFSDTGLRLESTDAQQAWYSSWSLQSHGYGDEQTRVQNGKLFVSGTRVEVSRKEPGIVEWFENRPSGMEHGFTLKSPPNGRGNGAPLRLVIGISGDLKPRTEGELGLVLRDNQEKDVLRYEKLLVWDATGKILDAAMKVEKEGELWIEVDDDQASYPVTIDPTFVSEAKLLAPDGAAEDEFGIDVAIDGFTAVIGAHRANVGPNADQGAVYVFTGSGTNWSLQQKLTASDGTAQNDFGSSVSIQGDTILVGAPAKTIGSNIQQGKVYVFTRSGKVWTERQGLLAGDGGSQDHFGNSVSLDGDRAIIGASEDTIGSNTFQGSAYIFVKSGDNWTQEQKIVAADSGDSDDFGNSVSISGSTVVIGARNNNGTGGVNQGAAYVYTRSGSNWSLQQKLTASNAGGFEQFGYDVAISEETVIVGTRSNSSAYVFVRSGTTWTEQQKLNPSDQLGYEAFGFSVALKGDTAAIGSVSKVGNNNKQGAVYIFERSGTTWTQSQKLIATDGLANDYLGHSVAISSRAVISGAILDDENSQSSQGSAYIFHQALPDIDLTISRNPITDQLTLDWNTQPGKFYSVEGSTNLNGFPVEVLLPFEASDETASHSFPLPGEQKMFYRVRESDAVQ